MVTIYKNNDIPNEYHFIDIHDNYIDFYNTDNVLQNQNYSIYRVYKENQDLYLLKNITTYENIDVIEVNTSDNYIYRNDYKDICFISLCYFLLVIFIINIITSLIRRNGLLGGLL